MTTEPKRLCNEDPGIAHLVASTEKDGPSVLQMEKLLALASAPMASAPRRSRWGWTGSTLVVGLAVVAASVGAFSLQPSTPASRQSEVRAAGASSSPHACEDDSERCPRHAGEARTNENSVVVAGPVSASGVVTVSIEDLAPAPVASAFAPPARKASMPAAPPRHGHGANRAIATASAASTFDEELALVSAARSAIERGDAPGCLRAVDTYRASFASGTFTQEIDVLRIEGLVLARDHARARAAANQFLSANERSPYADRVQSIIDRGR